MGKLQGLGGAAAILLALGACASGSELTMRAQATPFASGEHPASFRVAEARGHFALGNIALAAEGFRKAMREDPESVDALNGLAACYDRMGRFDLSRGYYERALALAPDDARLYANLATSLVLQGKKAEAAEVRAELTSRLGAAKVASVPLQAATPVPEQPAPAVSLALPVAEPVAAQPEPVRIAIGPRMERLNLSEVMLVTEPRRSVFAEVKSAVATLPEPIRKPAAPVAAAPVRVTLLNAARVSKLAANSRLALQRFGWRQVAIGNAPRVLAVSELSYPNSRKAEAERLARQLGITPRQRAGNGEKLVLLLGRDAVRRRPSA